MSENDNGLHLGENTEDVNDDINQEQPDLLLQKIKDFLLHLYTPVIHPSESELTMDTIDIFQKIQRLYPSDCYTAETIAQWLNEAGFTFYEMASMRFEWLLKHR